MRELKAETNEEFKCKTMRASLQTNKENVAMIHPFTTALCVMNKQAPPKTLNLPEVPQMATTVIEDDEQDGEDGDQ